MSKSKVEVKYNDLMSFSAEVNGHSITLDADHTVGGKNLGPRPKPLILVALAGCTGMDVVSILEKMKVKFNDFAVDVDGELTEEHPKYYHKIHITYKFKGHDLPLDKINKAINLSQDRYCGVSAMLSKAATITFDVVIEE
jgi:putative redox protein